MTRKTLVALALACARLATAAEMDHGHDTMHGAGGPYPMTRDASGTSWQPDATPMTGLHLMADGWMLMAHGFVNAVADRQSGARGDDKVFAGSMAMVMASRAAGPGTVGVRAMLSLDPTMGRRGYPLLFQTGETADGRTRLVDRQHPHDAFMELSSSYSVPLGNGGGAAFGYVGLPGEPALGPPAYMHRASAMRNPEAPLTHHRLDSTHITAGVATIGASRGPLQLEASWFNGREPDQQRWNIESRAFDSWSTRLSFNPTPELALQLSHGRLKSPEQLEPETRLQRTTASLIWQTKVGGSDLATTFAYGRNRRRGGGHDGTEPGWLLESTWLVGENNTVFGRAEQVRTSELLDDDDAVRVRKLSLGAIRDVGKAGGLTWGIGALVGLHDAPSRLDGAYGRHSHSAMVFVQGRL